MNDAADTKSTATEIVNGDARDAGSKATGAQETVPASSPQRNGNGGGTTHVDGKSDSEAETVVLPGKERGSTSPHHRTIKHEGNDDGKLPAENSNDADSAKKGRSDQTESSGSVKAKKISKEHTATSSNLSSTKSSPVPELPNSSRAGSEAAQPRPKSQADSDSISRASHTRKRKIQSEDIDEKTLKRRHRRDGSLENAARSESVEGEGRDKKKADSANSISPPPRTRQRAMSMKDQNGGNASRRRKPPPLQVGSRGKGTEDGDGSSNESTSPLGQSHFKRLTSGAATATSPIKIPQQRRTRDKSGRTPLARLCDSEDPDAIRTRLTEHPEELNEADYAGNTPLQIASLAGNHPIVKVLLDSGCKIDCKNVDNDTPLIDAVENCCVEVIKLLLDAGIDPRQSNNKGQQAFDLLDSSTDEYDEIKALLMQAQNTERRHSKEQSAPTGPDGNAVQGLRSSSSVNSPPPASASRRRTARREATRNDLLWIGTTKDNLREKARIGDYAAVDYILSVNPGAADAYAVLAAARGGHETTLEFLLASEGSVIEADPDLLAGERLVQATPMLAAIGRGNTRVIELLLKQKGFNPARRFHNKTYYEHAKDRKGLRWEEEYRLLKEAYQKHKGLPVNGSPSSSKKSKAEDPSSSARSDQRSSQSNASKDDLSKKKPSKEGRRSDIRDDSDLASPERIRQLSQKHLQVPSKTSSREPSVAVSDREMSPSRRSDKKSQRSLSEAEVHDDDAPKPRKRLISKRELQEGEKQRRTSVVSVASSSGPERGKPRPDQENSPQRIKVEESQDRVKSVKGDISKKRPRPSTTSPESKSPETRRSPDDAKKTKRPRVEGDLAPSKRSEPEAGARKQKSHAKDKSLGITAAAGSTAGDSSAAQGKDVGKASKSRPDGSIPSRARKELASLGSKADSSATPKPTGARKDTPQRDTSDQLQREMEAAVDAEQRKRKPQQSDSESLEKPRKTADGALKDATSERNEQQHKDHAERQKKTEEEEAERKAKIERKNKAKQEEAKREAKAKEEEAKREAKVKEEEEAARKVKAEQEEAERKAKAEKEEAERQAKAEREAEEARLEKQRQEEEEQARKAAERERLRKEEEERQARRRREQEERDRLAMLRRQQEEEQRIRDMLPRALRMVAEMGPDKARQLSEVEYWLPLCVAQGRQLDPNCDSSARMEKWVCNLQVAPLLGIYDIDLSQYTAWAKRPATDDERLAILRRLRRRLTRYFPSQNEYDNAVDFQLAEEVHQKYNALRNIFWVRMSDLQDIISRYPHLSGTELTTSDMVWKGTIHPHTAESQPGPSGPNGSDAARAIVNGVH